jgi:hypothetical protein
MMSGSATTAMTAVRQIAQTAVASAQAATVVSISVPM